MRETTGESWSDHWCHVTFHESFTSIVRLMLPEHEVEAALAKADVNRNGPFLSQGFDLAHACVTVVYTIREVLGQR